MNQLEWKIRLQNESEIIRIFSERMQQDFPPAELKPLNALLRLNNEGFYRAYGIYAEDDCLAYAYCMVEPGTGWMLLDYYAVRADCRGHGIGSWFLKKLPTLEPEYPKILIENEDADRAESDAERLLRNRRTKFYQRAGAVLSETCASAFGVCYKLLTFSPEPVPADEVARNYERLYRRMLGKRYESAVRIALPGEHLL